MFKHEGEMKQWPIEKITVEWRRQLADPSVKKPKYKGETMIGRLLGVRFTDDKWVLCSTLTTLPSIFCVCFRKWGVVEAQCFVELLVALLRVISLPSPPALP